MQLKFPLSDVKIEINSYKKEVANPLFDDGFFRLNQTEFSMNVEGVASFYASRGNYVSMVVDPKATNANIELYLNGSVYGAILHQRKIMPMHGSCFVFNNKGIMLCGESGAGKSSLTASFVLDRNEFLTDDVTPILFSNGKPLIWTMSDRIKLWEDSLIQLNENKEKLVRIDPETEKFYYPLKSYKDSTFILNHIFLIEIHDKSDILFQEIKGAEKVTALRNEIYRLEYLQGMRENEVFYFNNLVKISKTIKITKLLRPKDIPIEQTKNKLKEYLCIIDLPSAVSSTINID
jgi:hypothetical protein